MAKHEWVSGPKRRFVLAPEDVDELEGHTMTFTDKPREEAEEHAYGEYKKKHHLRAAAHHLAGMRAASSAGEHAQAKRHKLVYDLHIRALGLPDDGKVPSQVQNLMNEPEHSPAYKFNPHKADAFLLGKNERGEYAILSKTDNEVAYRGRVNTKKVAQEIVAGLLVKALDKIVPKPLQAKHIKPGMRFKLDTPGGPTLNALAHKVEPYGDRVKITYQVENDGKRQVSYYATDLHEDAPLGKTDTPAAVPAESGGAEMMLSQDKKPYTGRDVDFVAGKLPPGAPGANKAGAGIRTDKKKEADKKAARKWKPGKDEE